MIKVETYDGYVEYINPETLENPETMDGIKEQMLNNAIWVVLGNSIHAKTNIKRITFLTKEEVEKSEIVEGVEE